MVLKKFLCAILTLCVAALALAALPACKGKESSKRTSYDIFAIYDDAEGLSATVDFCYYNNTGNEISDLKFNLYGNAFREDALYKPVSETYKTKAYYAGNSFGSMKIVNVENCAGWAVSGEDENLLIVNLLNSVYPDQTVKIKISYKLDLAKVNHRTGVTQSTVNLGNFYPVLCAYGREGFVECPYYTCGDPFLSECANYKVTLDVPEAYTVAASGKTVEEKASNGRKVGTYAIDNARDFALVLSDKFSVLESNVDGVALKYYYVSDKNAQVSLSVAEDSLKYFSKTFGKYVYPSLSVVQTGFCYGGMEYPGLTMIAEGLDSDASLYTIVHENAHQWWYAMVGSDQINNPWQDEGLAEYSTVMFFENNPTYGFTRTGIVKSATSAYRAFYTVYSQLNGAADTTMTRCIKDYSGELEYDNIAYNKGLLLFEMLRESTGDKKFTEALQNYYKRCIYKIASADDICSCFLAGGTDLEGLFKSFIEGKIII